MTASQPVLRELRAVHTVELKFAEECVQPLAGARGSWLGANLREPPASAGGYGPKLHIYAGQGSISKSYAPL